MNALHTVLLWMPMWDLMPSPYCASDCLTLTNLASLASGPGHTYTNAFDWKSPVLNAGVHGVRHNELQFAGLQSFRGVNHTPTFAIGCGCSYAVQSSPKLNSKWSQDADLLGLQLWMFFVGFFCLCVHKMEANRRQVLILCMCPHSLNPNQPKRWKQPIREGREGHVKARKVVGSILMPSAKL